jgi:inner membrane protein involved in colicin E2 resistance
MKIFDNLPEFSLSFKITPKRSFIAAVVASLLAFFTTQCGISEEKFLQFYNELRRKFNPANLPDKHRVLEELDNELNRRIIQNEELLQKRIELDVDEAVRDYKRYERQNEQINMKNEVILNEIKSSEYTEEQKQIIKDAIYYEFEDGTMGIRGAWVEPDPREIRK